ncbi:MAG: dihydropteroate synthase [Chitinivibrionales bacterium]|nr:dihydropteroate synthase [Chitinivibrionales bacterium]
MNIRQLSSILEQPFAVMGIVNVTPDSFFDGGKYIRLDRAYEHAVGLIEQGADIVDIGGESTRPGATPVTCEEELQRTIPLIEKLATTHPATVLSIDTTKSAVARRALESGAHWVNDISAGRFDAEMPALVAQAHCPVIVMHSRKQPATMQSNPRYEDVVAEVKQELIASIGMFRKAGVETARIIVDPGIGFAKRLEDNITLLNRLNEFAGLGYPLLVGVSRKSFVGRITGKEPAGRLAGSLGAVASAWLKGAKLFRVHDVAASCDMLAVMAWIENGHVSL